MAEIAVTRRATAVVCTTAGLAIAVGLVAHEVMQTNFNYSLAEADYVWGPLEFGWAFAVAGAFVGVAIAAFGAISIREAWTAAKNASMMRTALALAAVSGGLFGACFAAITAPSIGANIGGGAAMLLGLPIAVMLLAVALSTSLASATRA